MNKRNRSIQLDRPLRVVHRAQSVASVALVISLALGSAATAQQQSPSIGYMFPPGGQAGTEIPVMLGGYDWTPDMQVFVHAPGFELKMTGKPGPVLVPEPPYWFGKKARRSPFPLPRETPAVLTIPANAKPGVYRWQAANANGASATGRFIVSDFEEVHETSHDGSVQDLAALPVVVSGQIRSIEEVDRYRITPSQSGPINLSLAAASIGSPLTAVVQVQDASGRFIADAADTEGDDLQLTFAAVANESYLISLYDVDFRGNRSYVYRLTVRQGPRVVATIPAGGRAGETRQVEFIGYGLVGTGPQLESFQQTVTFPDIESSDQDSASVTLDLNTTNGRSNPITLLVSDLPEIVEPDSVEPSQRLVSMPSAITGTLEEPFEPDRYWIEGNQGDRWLIDLRSTALSSGMDLALVIRKQDGTELTRSDDTGGTLDVRMEWSVPETGRYELIVSDLLGHSGSRASTYRLAIDRTKRGFHLRAPEFVNLPLGGKATIDIQVDRYGGLNEEIALTIDPMPPGVQISGAAVIPPEKNAAKIELTSDPQSGTLASVVHVTGRVATEQGETTMQLPPIILAIQMPVPFAIDAEGKDDVTKWPRGSTFPAPVLIERQEGFEGEIVLEMASKQGRHRQGIRGPELTVSPDTTRILYPVFLPEWLETTRTSRMVVNGVATIKDPTGVPRHLSSKLKTRIGFLPTGAMFKIDCPDDEFHVQQGVPFSIPLIINRVSGVDEPVHIEIVTEGLKQPTVRAEPVIADGTSKNDVMVVATSLIGGEHPITLRATLMREGRYPAVSETTVLVICEPSLVLE